MNVEKFQKIRHSNLKEKRDHDGALVDEVERVGELLQAPGRGLAVAREEHPRPAGARASRSERRGHQRPLPKGA